ncbi:MAG: DUF5690 family protein [Polyangiaceae bacterium]
MTVQGGEESAIEPAAPGPNLEHWLNRVHPIVFAIYAAVSSFAAYFFMYFYRKPFAAGTYATVPHILGLDAKSAYVIAQVVGYAASKMLGIKVVSELHAGKRARAILLSIVCAEAALVAFALLPSSLGMVALALNGLSLGMIWGMVFGFLEGRVVSDWLGAALCASFIVGSGAAKSLGKALLEWGVAERWMPAAAGAVVAPAMLLFVAMLAQIPPPTQRDVAARTERVPMNAEMRRAFFRSHAAGLVPLVIAYVALTAFRDFRDNFATEIWDKLGFGKQPLIMTTTEIPVAVGAVVGVALIGLFRKNRAALLATHVIIVAGALLVGAATLAFQAGLIQPVTWMISVGLGLYVAYVPYNCVLFDRLVAATGSVANAGFLIYVADASGYLGSVATLIYKNAGRRSLSWVSFLQGFGLFTSALMLAMVSAAAFYFHRATSAPPKPEEIA